MGVIIPISKLSERDAWEMAAALIGVYGDDLGRYVLDQMKLCFERHEPVESAAWIAMMNRIEALGDRDVGEATN